MPYMYKLVYVHMRHLCQYICFIWIQCNEQCDQQHWYTFHMTYRPHITVHTNNSNLKKKKKKKMPILFTMVLPYMYQQQICPLNSTYMPHMSMWLMYSYEEAILVYMHHVHSLQSKMWPAVLVYIPFTLLAYAPQEICLPKLFIYKPLEGYYSLHINPTALHISVRKQ